MLTSFTNHDLVKPNHSERTFESMAWYPSAARAGHAVVLARTLCSDVCRTFLRRSPRVRARGWRTRDGSSRPRASGATRCRYVVMHAETHLRAMVRTARSCNEQWHRHKAF